MRKAWMAYDLSGSNKEYFHAENKGLAPEFPSRVKLGRAEEDYGMAEYRARVKR